MLPLVGPAVELAHAEGVTLVVETGNGTMVNSNYTARKLIDDLDAKDALRVLWDPDNNSWYHELAYPDGYEELRDGYIGHIHIKDVKVDTPRATLEVRRMGEGQLAHLFAPIAAARSGATAMTAWFRSRASITRGTGTSRPASGCA